MITFSFILSFVILNKYHVQNRRRLQNGYSGSNSRISFLRKESRDEQIQSLGDGSSCPLTHGRSDPLLWAFVSTFYPAEPPIDARQPSVDGVDCKLKEKINDASASR